MNTNKSYAWILIACGLLGLIASSVLTVDKITLLQDPSYVPPCNINPLVSCGSIMESDQAEAFGFPNSLLGIVGYSFVLMTGVILLLDGVPSKKFWKLFLIGIVLSLLFIHWLIFNSVYVIGNLCLYCMIVWAVSWPIFIYTLKNNFSLPFVNRNHLSLLIGWYLLIILLILIQFRDFFLG
jgi:uncharacterized membrane protein